MLTLQGVHTYYGDSHVLRGISMQVERGAIVALLGRNGMGKTTTMRSITGLTPPREGRIELAGRSIAGMRAHQISRLGVALVPQGRRIFPGLSVEENLRVPFRRARQARHRSGVRGGDDQLDYVYRLFPRLWERRSQDGATLSGGEQQMLAIGRALVTEPDVLLLDEPSEGLAPGVVGLVTDVIGTLRQAGMTVLLVEQIVTMALAVADYVYILDRGEVVYQSTPAKLQANPAAMRAHLGVGG